MKLSEEQENRVRKFVDTQGLSIQLLRDDVIDHLCCVIESKLDGENSFEDLLQNAANELSPSGLIEIENRTIFFIKLKTNNNYEKANVFNWILRFDSAYWWNNF